MTNTDWEELRKAYEMLRNSSVTRLENAYWTIYKVGLNIRIDIKEST